MIRLPFGAVCPTARLAPLSRTGTDRMTTRSRVLRIALLRFLALLMLLHSPLVVGISAGPSMGLDVDVSWDFENDRNFEGWCNAVRALIRSFVRSFVA